MREYFEGEDVAGSDVVERELEEEEEEEEEVG